MRVIIFTIISLLLPVPAAARLPEIDFVSVPAGNFLMGTADLGEARIEMPADSSPAIDDEQPVHLVTLGAFEIGKFEITQQQWLTVMGTKPGPTAYWQQPNWQNLPVVSVTWHDTQAFINKLNEHDKQYSYRLPSEAEWEYVARGNNTELRPFPVEDMDDYAWTITNSGDVPHPVGQLKANHLGVHDIFGNAWEWVNDWYAANGYIGHTTINPQGPADGKKKVRRGGSYHCATHFVRSAYRAADVPAQRYSVIGFRLVREPMAN